MTVQRIVTPAGEEMVVLPAQEFQDLIDARDAALLMADVRAGRTDLLSEAEVDDYLAAPTPLAFWRRKRGLTQVQLAEAAGISQAYLSQIEGGHRIGDVDTVARLAKALKVRVEDLLAD